MPAITVRGVTLLPPRDTAPTNFKILVPVMANDLSNAAAAGAGWGRGRAAFGCPFDIGCS